MKRIGMIAVVLSMVLGLGGCSVKSFSQVAEELSGGSGSESGSTGTIEGADMTKDDVKQYENEDGTYTYEAMGYGTAVETDWFNYAVTDAYYVDASSLPDGTVPADHACLAVEMVIKNTFRGSVDMYYSDFQIQWGAGDDDYDYPLEENSAFGEDQFPDEYKLSIGETRTGVLYFSVPEGCSDVCIAFMETYDDETTGDVFFNYFTINEGESSSSPKA